VSGPLRARHREVLLHTGQHYDAALSDRFFEELPLPAPDHALGVGSGTHAEQTGRMLMGIEHVIACERPDVVLVYGDTNSTLAGALAAAKCHVPVAHVEAGLRSFNRRMPEEINRVLTDQLSSVLFCPSTGAAANLEREGIRDGVHVVGDVMAEALQQFGARYRHDTRVVEKIGVVPGEYALLTVHRAENTDDPSRLSGILDALEQLGETVVFPAHPRVLGAIARLGAVVSPNVRVCEPLGYADMIALEAHARVVLTDSGGVQKEAYWLGVPCVTLRDETEWVETLATGWNVLAGAVPARIVAAARRAAPDGGHPRLYCEGGAVAAIVEQLGP
jgi:UDP-GlcNAc3NAcA epimerase